MNGEIPDFSNLTQITFIRLDENQLSGAIPNFNLPKLESLVLSKNQLNGEIPNFNLASLTQLNLSDNQLSGEIPNFTNLPQISILYCPTNMLNGNLPSFENCPALELLNFDENQLSGAIPEYSNESLRVISIAHNSLTSINSFSNLINLEQLILEDNQIAGNIPDFNLPKLEVLNLSHNLLSGTIPNWSSFPELKSILLGYNELTGTIPAFNFPKLESLHLYFNQLSGSIPDFNLPKLKYLRLSSNNLTGPIPNFDYAPLQSLYLDNNQLSGCYNPSLCNISANGFLNCFNNPELPNEGSFSFFSNYCTDYNSQYYQPCNDGDPNTTGEVITLDCKCALPPNLVTGNIRYDINENCLADSLEHGLSNWLIKFDALYPIYTNTDSSGNYSVYIDNDSYQVSIVSPNLYWESCLSDTLITLDNEPDTVRLDFLAQAAYDCPLLRVDVSTPFLRRCFPNTYQVNYCNEGTLAETNAFIEISFDEWLTVDSSTIAWTSQSGNTFTFPIGQVDIGACSSFKVYTTLDCDSTQIGQTHCVEAAIFPDSICLPPNTLWDGSTVSVDGVCTEDSIRFSIKNIGEQDMSAPLNYIVIEDQIIHLNGSFQLQSGTEQIIMIGATGHTYRLEADQAAYHPTSTMPAVTVAACNIGNNPINLGFVNFFGDPDQDPFISIDCQENIGSFDPNDKRGFPKGIGENHIIFPDTDLEYHIRFQNTGTDTAFNIVIRDTISDFLDLESLRVGASSHEYQWQLFPDNRIEFSFNNIMLPDSNVNELASHGFVKFKIQQKPDNLAGTIIENQAAIYFDFNDPIFTNNTSHQVEEKPVITDSIYVNYCEIPFYSSDTTIIVASDLSSYEVATTNFISIIGGQQSILDLTLASNASFNGINYQNDTTLYQVYEASNGCDSLVIINLDILTDLNPTLNQVANISLSPNPSDGEVFLFFEGKENINAKMELYNIQGQKLATELRINLNKGQQLIPLDLSHLNNGLYFIHIIKDNIKFIKKLMINK